MSSHSTSDEFCQTCSDRIRGRYYDAEFHLFLGREIEWPTDTDRPKFQDMVKRYMAYHSNIPDTDEKKISDSLIQEYDRRHDLGKIAVSKIIFVDARGWSNKQDIEFWSNSLNAYIEFNGYYSQADKYIVEDAMMKMMNTPRYANS
jgi:hypothetical protein